MKLKSFTIIEVLIATAIFVCVVALSATSYGMVIKSDRSSREQNTNLECLSSFDNFLFTEIKSADRAPFIWGAQKEDTRFIFSKVDSKFPAVKQLQGLLVYSHGLKNMIFFSGEGLYSLPVDDKDFEKGYVNSENIDKKITNLLPNGCRTNLQIEVAASAGTESYLVQIKGEIFRQGNVARMPVDLSVATGEGI